MSKINKRGILVGLIVSVALTVVFKDPLWLILTVVYITYELIRVRVKEDKS